MRLIRYPKETPPAWANDPTEPVLRLIKGTSRQVAEAKRKQVRHGRKQSRS